MNNILTTSKADDEEEREIRKNIRLKVFPDGINNDLFFDNAQSTIEDNYSKKNNKLLTNKFIDIQSLSSLENQTADLKNSINQYDNNIN
jgi:CRISPR/Cas system CSM-associated protein Csm4 (group 5 of RAMP superfamily)